MTVYRIGIFGGIHTQPAAIISGSAMSSTLFIWKNVTGDSYMIRKQRNVVSYIGPVCAEAILLNVAISWWRRIWLLERLSRSRIPWTRKPWLRVPNKHKRSRFPAWRTVRRILHLHQRRAESFWVSPRSALEYRTRVLRWTTCGRMRCKNYQGIWNCVMKHKSLKDTAVERLPDCNPGLTVSVPHPHNCNWFVHCENGNRSIQQCQHLFHFDMNLNRCIILFAAKCIKD